MPVRYANFVWWDAKELEHLVEGRVPGFHGELQLHSAMTNDVMHALEVLTKEKGIPAQISAVSDPAHQVVVLRIDSPRVLFGDLKPSEEFHAAMGGSTASLEHGLKGSEFSSLDTPETIVNDLKKIFSSGGYLDVTINPPVFSAPRASGANYFVDGSAAIHRGEQYRVSSVTFDGAPAGMEGALRNEANVKSGGPASPSAADLSNADLEGRLAQFGYLDAQSSVATANNPPAHSVAYTFRINSGPLYHLSGIDASKATPDIQTALAKDSRLKPGVVLDQSVSDAISEDIHKYDPQKKQRLVTRIHREEKDTANIVLNPVALPPVH
jgi:outer membrane protein assembly factor BamA